MKTMNTSEQVAKGSVPFKGSQTATGLAKSEQELRDRRLRHLIGKMYLQAIHDFLNSMKAKPDWRAGRHPFLLKIIFGSLWVRAMGIFAVVSCVVALIVVWRFSLGQPATKNEHSNSPKVEHKSMSKWAATTTSP